MQNVTFQKKKSINFRTKCNYPKKIDIFVIKLKTDGQTFNQIRIGSCSCNCAVV